MPSNFVELAPGASGGLSQDKYSTARFVPFLALDAVPDDRPRARDREEEGSMWAQLQPLGSESLIPRIVTLLRSPTATTNGGEMRKRSREG